MDAEAARVARGAALIRGVMGFFGFLALGMPLVVVAVYYAAGWQGAVLVFPLLLMGIGRLTPPRKLDEKAARRRMRRRIVTLTILCAIPAAAVWWDEPEIMRLWAYAFAIPFGLSAVFDREAKISRGATILTAVIFVAASDVIWLFGSIAQWIWFHAFAVPIFLFGSAFLHLAFTHRERDQAREITVEKVPPLPEEGDQSSLAVRCVIVTGNGEKWIFSKVSRSQVQAIYAAAEWRRAYDNLLEAAVVPEGVKKPQLLVAFKGNGVLKFEVDGPSTVAVQWIYMEARQKGRLFGSACLVGETNVPDALGPEIIADVWNDDVETIKARLQPFATPSLEEV